MNQYVAAEGETMLKKGEAEKAIEHGDARPNEESNLHERNDDNMDDAEDLVCAPGWSSDIRIASPVNTTEARVSYRCSRRKS